MCSTTINSKFRKSVPSSRRGHRTRARSKSMPALRQPPGAEQPVAFDDIMVALGELDSDRGYIRPTTTSDRKYRSDQSLDA